MATYTKIALSGASNGLPVIVAATSSPGTTIHTAVSGTTSFDEIYLWATNLDSATRTLTLQWGGTTDPTNLITKSLSLTANSAPLLIANGLLLQNGLLVKVFASVTNIISISGFVNRIS